MLTCYALATGTPFCFPLHFIYFYLVHGRNYLFFLQFGYVNLNSHSDNWQWHFFNFLLFSCFFYSLALSGILFFSYMIEDKTPSGLSYLDFLVRLHRQIQTKMAWFSFNDFVFIVFWFAQTWVLRSWLDVSDESSFAGKKKSAAQIQKMVSKFLYTFCYSWLVISHRNKCRLYSLGINSLSWGVFFFFLLLCWTGLN